MSAAASSDWVPLGQTPGSPLPTAFGCALDEARARRIWKEISAGQWIALAARDSAGSRFVLVALHPNRYPVDWGLLGQRERDVLDLIASDCAQKVIAMTLGLSPASVSAAIRSARERLGFASVGRLVRAYCAESAFNDRIETES